MFLNKGFFS